MRTTHLSREKTVLHISYFHGYSNIFSYWQSLSICRTMKTNVALAPSSVRKCLCTSALYSVHKSKCDSFLRTMKHTWKLEFYPIVEGESNTKIRTVRKVSMESNHCWSTHLTQSQILCWSLCYDPNAHWLCSMFHIIPASGSLWDCFMEKPRTFLTRWFNMIKYMLKREIEWLLFYKFATSSQHSFFKISTVMHKYISSVLFWKIYEENSMYGVSFVCQEIIITLLANTEHLYISRNFSHTSLHFTINY